MCVVVIEWVVGFLLTARPPLMRENVLVLLWFQRKPNIVLSALNGIQLTTKFPSRCT
jgi:hypothetical protein